MRLSAADTPDLSRGVGNKSEILLFLRSLAETCECKQQDDGREERIKKEPGHRPDSWVLTC